MITRTPYEGEWKTGERLIWEFQHPTLIQRFELRGPPGGWFTDVRVGNISCFHRAPGFHELPITELEARWARYMLPVADPGCLLMIMAHDLRGEIRPLGLAMVHEVGP